MAATAPSQEWREKRRQQFQQEQRQFFAGVHAYQTAVMRDPVRRARFEAWFGTWDQIISEDFG